jgi:hypothetical protein
MDDPLWQRDEGDEGTSLSHICAEVFPEVQYVCASSLLPLALSVSSLALSLTSLPALPLASLSRYM